MSPEKPRDAVLCLMGLLERGLRTLTPDQSAPFHKQVEARCGKLSDFPRLTEARRVRNTLAHGEDVSYVRYEEARGPQTGAHGDLASPPRTIANRHARSDAIRVGPRSRLVFALLVRRCPFQRGRGYNRRFPQRPETESGT